MGILDFFFPKRCLGCGRVGQYFCKECQSGLPLVENQICPECERPAIGGATHPGCKKHFGLDGLLSFFYFEGPIKDAIHKLKYRLIFDLAKELGDLVVDTRGNLKFLKTTNFTVVPVPLHPVRLKWRGFNQAEVLGQELANKLGCSFEGNLLQRIKNTRPQVELKGLERKKNIEEAFLVSQNSQVAISNLKIILVDDMWTTGATLRSCAKVLKRAGAKNVWGLTVARNR